MLSDLTFTINFFGLVMALWLGLYIVTRSPKSAIAWLTGFTLWAVAGLFLNVLLALNPPPIPTKSPVWLRMVFPFWYKAILEGRASSGWLQGWSVIPAIIFWHHATTLMRPGPLNPWRWTRIGAGYVIAAAAVIIQINTPFIFASAEGDPLYVNTLRAGPLYLLFALLLLLYTGMGVTNLIRSAVAAPTAMPRRQFNTLAAATVVGGLAGTLAIAASAFGVRVPMAALSVLLGVAVALIGYGVARFSALIDGRTLRRDFFYHAVAISIVAFLYLLVTWMSVELYNISAVAFIYVVMLAIVTHSLIDVARRGLDSIFFRQDTSHLRKNLRSLVQMAGEQGDQFENLFLALEAMSNSVRATYGLLIIFEEDRLEIGTMYRWQGGEVSLRPADLAADDILSLEPGHFAAPLTEAALLIPLYSETKQIGAIILGRPVNGLGYTQADQEFLLYPSDWIADTIQNTRREAKYLARIAELAAQSAQPSKPLPLEISVKAVEQALRHLADYAFLGEHPLAKTKLVKTQLPPGSVTHLDRGKAAYQILTTAIDKLKPDGDISTEPPPREWYPYLILHEAYVNDERNRDIMSRLYISEGTFNRTRRAALRAVTKTLAEMEAAA